MKKKEKASHYPAGLEVVDDIMVAQEWVRTHRPSADIMKHTDAKYAVDGFAGWMLSKFPSEQYGKGYPTNAHRAGAYYKSEAFQNALLDARQERSLELGYTSEDAMQDFNELKRFANEQLHDQVRWIKQQETAGKEVPATQRKEINQLVKTLLQVISTQCDYSIGKVNRSLSVTAELPQIPNSGDLCRQAEEQSRPQMNEDGFIDAIVE